MNAAYSESLFEISRKRRVKELVVHAILFGAATIGILTTFGILASLFVETFRFFQEVRFWDYITGTRWTPLFATQQFGIWPLITATFLTSMIALTLAVPIGLTAAIFLSDFATPGLRDTIKPLLEILAGVPTVVYGFFALTFVSPLLNHLIPGVMTFNALSAGLVMGIMIVPLISSLSEDALTAVPRSLREGAYAMGATRLEVATQVVVPAALSGIVASVILAMSRAVGETMIVAIAAGQTPNFTLDPTRAVQTMTSFIVQVSLGDTPAGSLAYKTIFAVGTSLFLMTFAMNMVSHRFVRRYREVYD